MKTADFTKLKALGAKLLNNKLLLYLLLAAGALILIWPFDSSGGAHEPAASEITPPVFSVEEQETKIREAIKSIQGVGDAEVVLSLRGTASRDLAKGNSEALVISAGGGTQSTVELRYLYPEYRGAVVICEGGDDPRVKLDVTSAVSILTGLGSDKITVVKMK